MTLRILIQRGLPGTPYDGILRAWRMEGDGFRRRDLLACVDPRFKATVRSAKKTLTEFYGVLYPEANVEFKIEDHAEARG